MPEEITQQYHFGGWTPVIIYSEDEMAITLDISLQALYQAIEAAQLRFHAHPASNALREYQFNMSCYSENIHLWRCLQEGGHFFEFDRYYDVNQEKAVYRCQNCPAERFDR